jgi:hypothetical protein
LRIVKEENYGKKKCIQLLSKIVLSFSNSLHELFKNNLFHKRWIDEIPINIKEGKDINKLIQQRN